MHAEKSILHSTGLATYTPGTQRSEPELPPQGDESRLVALPQPGGSLRVLTFAEARRAGFARETIEISPHKKAAHHITAKADSIALVGYRQACRVYYNGCLRQAAGETLSDDAEMVAFSLAARKLNKYEPDIASDLAEASKVVEAREWLKTHADDDRQQVEISSKIADFDAQLNDAISKIRSLAAPWHQKLSKLQSVIPVTARARHTAIMWDRLLDGSAAPPPGLDLTGFLESRAENK